MKQVRERIEEIVTEILAETEDLFLIDIIHKGNPGNTRVVVIIDGDHGIGIDACASVSRQLSRILEEEDPIEGEYTLEVTSAGLEHPLKLTRQYINNIGRNVKVVDVDGVELKGLLKAADENQIQLEIKKGKKEKEEKSIPYSSIKKTNVLVSFK